MTVADVARQWQAAGVSTIPISPNQTKKPPIRWKDYQTRLPLDGEMSAWWGNGHEYGLALIMGKVSGNVEMLELEARACTSQLLADVMNSCDEAGIGHVWDLLHGADGYSEMSPYGGLHFIYRIDGAVVPGNEKIATRPATDEELAEDPLDKRKVLAETRGEGGYVIVAPTSGLCHPSGESWVLINGVAGVVPTISWEDRCLLQSAIRTALHIPYAEAAGAISGRDTASAPRSAPLAPRQPLPAAVVERGAELRPGDDFEQQVSWSQLLIPQGWQKGMVESDGTTYWTRPGKDPRDGHSATTGHAGDRDRLWVFSTATEFPAEESITKFRAYSLLHHGGDDSAAAKQLSRLNFGSKAVALPAAAADFHFTQPIEESKSFARTDQGNAERVKESVGNKFRWVVEEKHFHRFDGQRWIRDHSHLYQEVVRIAEEMTASSDTVIAKWGLKSQSDAAVEATKRAFRNRPGITTSASEFNQHRHLLNLFNGTLNLHTGEFLPHDSELLITQLFQATYDTEATCPKFETFIEQVLPDPLMRAYVQRAVGATLLGDAGQRAVFLVHGPSGTGKTQFLELLRHLFGSYGVTAPASTFRAKRDSAPPHDLHQLRGKRFVASSETSDSASFDEEVLKRITGGDSISSRDLYEAFQDWTPECDIWMATNFPPRFNSDDNAMWERTKLIPFTTVIGKTEGAPAAVPNYARRELFAEADGILNWMLAGLAQYLEGGLQQPASIDDGAAQLRMDSDPVVQFLEELVGEGTLVVEVNERIASQELNRMYTEWSQRNGLRPVGARRFANRLETRGLQRVKSHGRMWFIGLRRGAHLSLAGTFGLSAAPGD